MSAQTITNNIISTQTAGSVVMQFMPLVKATARRYEGRGAEYEDLVQEGCVALMRLAPTCADARWLPAFLKNRLPGCVRAAAARLRDGRARGTTDLECIEETVSDADVEQSYEAAELRSAIERALLPDELDMVQALTEGFTQAEIARERGVTQQSIAARLKKIRRKLFPILRGEAA